MPEDGRIVLLATCAAHPEVTPGFTNFMIRRVLDRITFDAHATGGCVVTVSEDQARRLLKRLGEWL